MSLKKKFEEHPVIYVLGVLTSGVAVGAAMALWFFDNSVMSFDHDRYYPLKRHNEELIELKEEVNEAKKNCLLEINKNIQVSDSRTRNTSVIVDIKDKLSVFPYLDINNVFASENSTKGIEIEASDKPDLLIIHRHAFEKAKDSVLIEALEMYVDKNPKIDIIVYSQSFRFPRGQSDMRSALPNSIEENVSLLGVEYADVMTKESMMDIKDLVLEILYGD